MAKEVNVSVVIVNFNTPKLTGECIKSVFEQTKKTSFEVIVVDNASTDNSLEILSKNRDITLIKSTKNLGFAGGNNLGIKKAKGKYILLLNSDTIINDDAISQTYSWLENNPKIGICTCKLVGIDKQIQSPGGNFPTLLRVASWMTIEDLPFISYLIKPFHPSDIPVSQTKLDWVTGTFFMIRKKVIDEVGLLDEDYFMYTEEVDYCFRAMKKGWERWYVPTSNITHYGKASSNNEYALLMEYKGIKTFYKKHFAKWQYPVLRLLLKVGAILRVIIFSILGKRKVAKIYEKAISIA